MLCSNLESIMGVSADSIIDESVNLLVDREWCGITREGVKANLDVSLYNKDAKLLRMKDSPYYNGNLQLVMPITMTRKMSCKGAKKYLTEMIDRINDEDCSRNYDGLTIRDFINSLEGDVIITPDNIQNDNSPSIMETMYSEFDTYGYSKKKQELKGKIMNAIDVIRCNIDERISSYVATNLNKTFELTTKKFVEGQKTSKVVNRILNMWINPNLCSDIFVPFSDLVNTNEVECYFVVSLNFLDYLRVSDGVSWASCHTTDYKNLRDMPGNYSGAYAQGTLSYANDGVSYVSYIVEKHKADFNHPDRTPKLYRCMFHVTNDSVHIIEGRIYPQSNDGDTNLYDTFYRYFMQIMDLNPANYEHMGNAADEAYTETLGGNYRDYVEYDDPQYYIVRGRNKDTIYIGAPAYSCSTGEELDIDDEHHMVAFRDGDND